jgi:hypothetical protein
LLTALVVVLNIYLGAKEPMDITQILPSILINPIYQIALLILVFVNGRTILFRMDDKEVERRQ